MNFFEYFFCRFYWWNTEVIKEKVTPLFYSILGLSVFHTYTIVPLYCILYVLIYDSFYLEDILNLSPFVIINIIFFITDLIFFSDGGFYEYIYYDRVCLLNPNQAHNFICGPSG